MSTVAHETEFKIYMVSVLVAALVVVVHYCFVFHSKSGSS